MNKIIATLILSATMVLTTTAQEISYGFRAGLSFSQFNGDSEVNDAGEELENYSFTSGFHIGFAVDLGITDEFGFRGELLFSQKGTDYAYEGDSYYFLARSTPQQERLVFGRREIDLGVSQATLEIPLIAYYKIGFVEVSGGLYGSVLMASTGGGTLAMSNVQSINGNAVDPFAVTLQYNYNKDEARGAGPPDMQIEVGGNTVLTPSLTGAYYDYDVRDKNLYETIDFGLTGGLAFYLNEGLYISGRVTYGLLDVDRNEYDISYYRLNEDNDYIQRADTNRNITIQASVGFLF